MALFCGCAIFFIISKDLNLIIAVVKIYNSRNYKGLLIKRDKYAPKQKTDHRGVQKAKEKK